MNGLDSPRPFVLPDAEEALDPSAEVLPLNDEVARLAQVRIQVAGPVGVSDRTQCSPPLTQLWDLMGAFRRGSRGGSCGAAVARLLVTHAQRAR